MNKGAPDPLSVLAKVAERQGASNLSTLSDAADQRRREQTHERTNMLRLISLYSQIDVSIRAHRRDLWGWVNPYWDRLRDSKNKRSTTERNAALAQYREHAAEARAADVHIFAPLLNYFYILCRKLGPQLRAKYYALIERKWGQQTGWSPLKVSYVLANYEQLKLSALAALIRSHAGDPAVKRFLHRGQDVDGLFRELLTIWRQYQHLKDNIRRVLMDAGARAGASGARSGGLS